MNILCNHPLPAYVFVELLTELCYTRCNTMKEAKLCLMRNHIGMGEGWEMTEIDQIPADTNVVLVEFSKEDDYTQYEYRFMRVQKRFLNRFKKNLKELEEI